MKRQKLRRFISVLLSFTICLTVLPFRMGSVRAEEAYTATFYIDEGCVVINDSTATGYGESGKKISISNSAGSKYLITQHDATAQTYNNISVSGTQDITLRYVNIYEQFSTDGDCYAMMINENSNVKVTIDTYASLTGGSMAEATRITDVYKYAGYAGLQVHESSSVEIYGLHGDANTDYLYACGGYCGSAGIGGGYGSGPVTSIDDYRPNAGNITIYSGHIYAETSNSSIFSPGTSDGGAGIGCGATGALKPAHFNNISILGGKVDAYGGTNSSGIGAGENAEYNGTITIRNAVVFASAGGDCPDIGGTNLGAGLYIQSGTVTVLKRDSNGVLNQDGNIGIENGKYVVSGGTILHVNQFHGTHPTVSDTNSTPVYPTVITLPQSFANVPVTNLSVTYNGEAYPYGGDQIFVYNQLVLYLPTGSLVVKFDCNGNSYQYTGSTSNDKGFFATYTLKMDQSPLSITGLASQYTYGDAIPAPSVSGGSSNGTLTGVFTGRDGTNYNSSTAPSDVGKYTYTATMAGNDSYYDQTATCDFEIKPKNITFSVDKIADQTYTGSALTPEVVVKDGTKTLEKGTDYTVDYDMDNVNVGMANVFVAGIGNYKGSVGQTIFAIRKKEITITLSADRNGANAGSDVALTTKISDAVDLPKGSIQFQYDSQVIATSGITQNSDGTYEATAVWSSAPAGTYTLTATYVPQNDDNYTATSPGSVNGYSITKQDQKPFAFSSGTIKKTYGDTDFALLTQGGSGSGAVTYQVSAGSDVLSVNGDQVTIKKSGMAVITAVKAADANYNEISATATIVVNKAQSSIVTLPVSSVITAVGKLSSAKLAGGKSNVDGAFSWENPDLVISATGEYDVTFTPVDLENYLPCTGKVEVKVDPIITGSSSDVILDLSGVTLPSGVTSVSLGSSQFGEGSTSYNAVFKLISNNASLGGLEHLVLYDMKLLDQNGSPIENFTGKMKVKVKIPDGMSGNLYVYWYNPNNNTLTDMSATKENGYLVFETTHFSFYTIANLSTASSDNMGTNPDTGNKKFPAVPLMLLGAGSAAGLIIVKKRARFRMVK